MALSRRHMFAAGAALAVTSSAAEAKPKSLEAAIAAAQEGGGVVLLEGGRYITSGLEITGNIIIQGVPGRTVILGAGAGAMLTARDLEYLTLSGVSFDGSNQPEDLVTLSGIENLTIEKCSFSGSEKTALTLSKCGGRIVGNRFEKCGQAALFSIDSRGLDISSNTVDGMGNNGILVWTSEPAEDGSRITNNLIRNIAARDGGSGQNGNGINTFRAGGIIISGNRITDCEYSAIRNNSGRNVQITNNNISRSQEIAIYAEFSYDGCVVSGNIVADSVFGISITNFDVEGRLAVCANNIVRNITGGRKPDGKRWAGGIAAEADTVVSNNVIENAAEFAIALGNGAKTRNLTVQGNLVRNCGVGVMASVVEGAGPHYVMNNVFAGSTGPAIAGFEWDKQVTGDLALKPDEAPASLHLAGNIVKT